MVLKAFQIFSDKGEVVLAMAVMVVIIGLLYQGMSTLWEGKERGFNNTNIIYTNNNQ